VDTKNTGDITGGQRGFLRLPILLKKSVTKTVHEFSPATLSGFKEHPNQWWKTESAGASASILSLTSL
jgi:hypothetical protein